MAALTTTPILHVEDSPSDALLTRVELENYPEFRLTQVERLDEALRVMAAQQYAVVLLDLGLPDSQGLETLVKIHREAPHVPVVVMTGSNDEELGLRAVQAGAQDYLVKGQAREFMLDRILRYAIERNLTRQALHERAVLASLTADVGLAFSHGASLRDMLQSCVVSMVDNLNAAFARIWTLNESTNVLELQVSAGLYTHIDGPHGRIPVGKFKIGLIAKRRIPHLTNDVYNDPCFEDQEWAHREGMIAFAGYPLLLEGRVIGVMALFARRALSEATLQAMASISNTIALGIDHQQTEARLKHLLLSSPVVIFSLALAGEQIRLSWISDKIMPLMGYETSECLLAGWWQERVHPEDAVVILNRWPRFLREGHSASDIRFRDKSGTYRWIREELQLLRDAAGRPEECVGSWSDITEHKRTEKHVLAQHAVTRVLADSPSLPEAGKQMLQALCEGLEWEVGTLWKVDRAANVMRCVQSWHEPSERLAEFTASSPQYTFAPGVGLPGRVWARREAAWIPELSADSNFPRRDIACQSGLRGGLAFPIMLGNEVLGVLDFFSQESRQPDEDVLRMMGAVGSQIGQFIERKQAEESLRETNRKLETLIQAAPLAIIVFDPQATVQTCNPAAERILGWKSEELVGHSVPYIPRESQAVFQTMFAKGMAGEVAIGLETRWVRKDGALVDVRVSTAPLRDTNGKVVGLLGMIADTTDEKRLEEQFRQSQKMEAVGQLAGGVAHDFNNLLTVIMGYCELELSGMPTSNPLRGSLGVIRDAGQRAAALTRQLLAFSRQSVMEPKILDMNEVVRETEKLLRRLIGEDVQLTAVLDANLKRVKVDPGQLGQVLMNLAVNARDAMPKGGKLTLGTRNFELSQEEQRFHSELTAGSYVVLSVSDTGTGMPSAVKARIFEPFFTTKGIGKGTGLGLAVVLGVVKQSGGHIEVSSEPDRGTTFDVYLPAVDDSVSASQTSDAESEGHGTESILLVEDEEGVRGLATLVLRHFGYRIFAASDASAAMRLVDEHPEGFDLLLTDVVMPGMGGPELAESLRLRLPRMKVLFTSGYMDDAVMRHGLLEESVAFIEKPYTPISLARKVRQVLDERPGAGSALPSTNPRASS